MTIRWLDPPDKHDRIVFPRAGWYRYAGGEWVYLGEDKPSEFTVDVIEVSVAVPSETHDD